ncbi:MAG: alpha-L-fucosidase [Chitinispirillaceae bacterium]|nr:alpha-L-fucosidase [Chitinispirillaceae bacterium]
MNRLQILAICCSLSITATVSATQPANYTATWASVNQHTPAPEWFKDAKFGLWFHWGVYSTAAFGSEWYPRNMYANGSSEFNHHVSTFGDPYSAWPYHNFINGANNKAGVFTQFAPKLKSAGGNFDPNEWASLFDSAGAKFAGPVAEHHDGFSLWNSTVSEWNSVSKGPKLDLVGLFATAFRAKGMKFFVSEHIAYGITGYFQYVPAQTTTTLQNLYHKLSRTAEEQKWLTKQKELIDLYQPDYMWHDFELGKLSEQVRLEYLAYYYNKAISWKKDVVASHVVRNGGDDGFNRLGEVAQFERGGPSDIVNPFWLAGDAISSSSWCYTQGIGYYSTISLLHALIDRVSKNGCLLLNISPMADGTIPQGQRAVLLCMGDWLRKFGESIYATRAWVKYGEGPTAIGGGEFSTPKTGTNRDWRFTRTKDSSILYAICLGWPGNGATTTIASITPARLPLGTHSRVYLLGASAGTFTQLNFNQGSAGLQVTMPAAQPYTALAYVLKIVKDATVTTAFRPGMTSEHCGRTMFRTSSNGFALDPDFAGKRKTIAAYDLKGRLVGIKTIEENRVDLKKWFSVGQGIHVVSVTPSR